MGKKKKEIGIKRGKINAKGVKIKGGGGGGVRLIFRPCKLLLAIFYSVNLRRGRTKIV